MARGPTYKVAFKRRREGKTNYYLRRSLLISGKHRVIIRPTVNNITCQVSDARMKGDVILAAAHSKELVKAFGWKYSLGNLPASYLVGYLLGKKAIKNGIEDGVADIGLRIHMNRTFAALKGIIDAGLDIPHGDEIFPDQDRLMGKHIEAFASQVKEEGDDAEPGTSHQFKKLMKDGVDLTKISSAVTDIMKKIDNAYK